MMRIFGREDETAEAVLGMRNLAALMTHYANLFEHYGHTPADRDVEGAMLALDESHSELWPALLYISIGITEDHYREEV